MENKNASPQETGKKTDVTLRIMAAQGVFCAIFLLVVLLLRLIGGGVYQWFGGVVGDALHDDKFLTDMSAKLYGTTTVTQTTVESIVTETEAKTASETTPAC